MSSVLPHTKYAELTVSSLTDRRAQTNHSDFVSGSVSSSSGRSAGLDVEAAVPEEVEEEEYLDEDVEPHFDRRRAQSTGNDSLFANIQWDDDLTPAPTSEGRQFDFRTSARAPWNISPVFEDGDDVPTPHPAIGERTPLIIRTSPSSTSLSRQAPVQSEQRIPQYTPTPRRISHVSTRSKISLREPKHRHTGQSTFAQTVRTASNRVRNLLIRCPSVA